MSHTAFPLSYALAGGRSHLTLQPDALIFAAPLRGIAEERIDLRTFRYFCVERLQRVSLKAKLMMDFDADVVLAWESAGALRHVRIAVDTKSDALRALLARLAELCPSSDLRHLPVPHALRTMKVPSRDRDVLVIVGVVLVGALLIAGLIAWMLHDV